MALKKPIRKPLTGGNENLEREVIEEKSSGKIVQVNENLHISFKSNSIRYNDGEIVPLLKLNRIDRNIDTDKIEFVISTKYLDKEVDFTIPRSEALTKKGILKLAEKGAKVNEYNAKYHIQSLEWQEEMIGSTSNSHSELGYFLYEGNEIFKLQKGININSTYVGNLDLKPKGALLEYLQEIRYHVSQYPSTSLAWVIGLSSAVVSMLHKLNLDINTLLVHFVGESSKGKSTATMLSISPWGNPKLGINGLYNSWNATENALISALSGNHGVAYALDELSMTKIENLTSLIYNITSGKDKARLTKEIELRESGTWITTIISNGEASILSKSNKNTGLDIRVLELEDIEWTIDAEHSESIKEFVNRCHGILGQDFAKKLIYTDNSDLIKIFHFERNKFIEELENLGIIDNKIERTSSKYAIILTTAVLINRFYITSDIRLDIDKIREILIKTEITSIERRGLEKRAEDYLMQVIESNSSKFKNGRDDKTNVDYWGTMRELSNGQIEVAILKNKFDEIMKQGRFEDPKVVIKQLKEEGKLDHENGRLTRKRKINAITTEVYVIRLSQ
ncbi:DUF927 domain-containing protein [Romboutsia timonensis]|uniref:DUF927 domain-containing protein n=1 Tax=Romboutsia timonensis TaxID=1776391 RepID=UPI0039921767